MFATDVSYVRDQLKRCSPEELNAAAKVADVHLKTLQRILKRKDVGTRAITISKLALHFRTREKRAA